MYRNRHLLSGLFQTKSNFSAMFFDESKFLRFPINDNKTTTRLSNIIKNWMQKKTGFNFLWIQNKFAKKK